MRSEAADRSWKAAMRFWPCAGVVQTWAGPAAGPCHVEWPWINRDTLPAEMGQEREVCSKFLSLLDPQLWKHFGLLEAWMGILLQECLGFFLFIFFWQRKKTRILMSVLDPKPIKDGSSCVNCRLLKAPKENHLPAKFLQFSFLDRLMLIRLFLMSLLLQNSTAANKDRTQSRRRARGE